MKEYIPGTQKARILNFFLQRKIRSLKELLTLKIADHRGVIRCLRNDGWIITHTQEWKKNFLGRPMLCVLYKFEGHIVNQGKISPTQTPESKKGLMYYIRNLL